MGAKVNVLQWLSHSVLVLTTVRQCIYEVLWDDYTLVTIKR